MLRNIAATLHLLTADLSDEQRTLLGCARTATDVLGTARCVQVGDGPAALPGDGGLPRAHAPFNLAWLGRHALARQFGPLRRARVHTWTLSALPWLHAVPGLPAVIDLPAEAHAHHALRAALAAGARDAWHFVVHHPHAERDLRGLGVPAGRCTRIDPPMLAGSYPARPADRSAARLALGLTVDGLVLLVLPPVSRASGAFFAVWAAVLAEETGAPLRVLLPGGGTEPSRIHRLAQACNREFMLHVPPAHTDLALWLAAADVAAYLPTHSAALGAVMTARALGVPLIVTPAAGANGSEAVWRCRARDPEDAARALLRAFAALPSPGARTATSAVRSTADVVEDYARVYAAAAG